MGGKRYAEGRLAVLRGHADRAKASPAAAGEQRKRGFPAPVTILISVLILVWMAAFFIPSGQCKLDGSGNPIAGSFRYVAPPLDRRSDVYYEPDVSVRLDGYLANDLSYRLYADPARNSGTDE